ncbi:hypothetical protein C0581_02220 [Candidatus Parcubacteria bacterium]|nr:MAG: hypothetical protein C0581_02220 [Candidatus Parcubacteria bacterium]
MKLPQNTIIAAGPVIIENDKVLLNREKKTHGSSFFMFPGGTVENFDNPFEETCKRECKEELGIDIEIIRPLQTLAVKRPENEKEMAIVVHYLAKRIGEINPGPETLEWDWFDIHNLPENCAENVKIIIENIKKDL